MSARQLLDQLLQSGQGLLSDAGSRVQNATGARSLLGRRRHGRAGRPGLPRLWRLAAQAGRRATATPPQTLDRLPAPQAEQHSSAVLTAMIGAAKADGHIGPEERGLARQRPRPQLARSRTGASAGSSPPRPAEMYLASLLVVDESFMERAYLDELARQLKLPPDLKLQLEQHAKAHAQTV